MRRLLGCSILLSLLALLSQVALAQEPTLGDPPSVDRAALPAPGPSGAVTRPEVAAARGWIDTSNRFAVLTAYHNVYDPPIPPPAWTGSIPTCQAGTISAAHRANAFNRVNWFRGMGGVLDGVVQDATFNTNAQEAALMMAANNALNHDPPNTWTCFTAAGHDGASHSNLYLGVSGPQTIDGFMEDPGTNNAAVGHRAWILEPTQVRMGFGSIPAAPQSAALYVVDGANLFPPTRPPTREPSEFVSWPPRGFVPNTKVFPRWSLQRAGADFSAATVQVTVGGTPVAAPIEWQGPSAATTTLTFLPNLPAFPPSSDLVVSVNVTGIAGAGVPTSYSWTTTVIPPSAPVAPSRTVADFDGDGDTDISVFRPSTGQWLIRNQPTVFLGASGDIPVPCDYDGDGTTDEAVFRPSVGGWYGTGLNPVFFGLSGDVPVPGDYNGDTRCDVAIFRPSVGGWYVLGQSPVFFGLSGDIPVPGDYDGNGSTDVAVFRPSVGGWYRSGAATTFFGLNGDIPVPGDYNGNGTTDIAIFRPSVGGWYVMGQAAQFLGLSTDIPVPGDYDGNDTTDLAVFRPSTGAWFVAGQSPVFHGQSGDRPLPLPSAIRMVFFP